MGPKLSYKHSFHLVFVLAAMLIISGQAVAGIDVQVDPDPLNPLNVIVQNEISLTLVPGVQSGQPTVLLAAYNDNPYPGGPGLGYSYSTNGGTSWTSGQLAAPINTISGVAMNNSFDPATTADSYGNLYIGHIAWDTLGYSAMVVRSSTNNGAAWSGETLLAIDNPAAGVPDPNFRLNDRCQLAADTVAASPYLGTVHAAWIKDRGNDPLSLPYSDIYVSHSINTNPATVFSADQRINDVGVNRDLANMPVPSVAADGAVYVSWLDYNVRTAGQGTIYIDKSTDGGVNWGTDITVRTIDLPPLNVTTQLPSVTDARAKGAPVLATHPTDPNELYIVYASDPDGIAIGPDEGDNFVRVGFPLAYKQINRNPIL